MDDKIKKIFTGKFNKSEKKVQKEIEEVKIPYVYKDAVLYAPGVWNEILFTKEAIEASFENTAWDKKNTSLFLDHADTVHDWVGDVQNLRMKDGLMIGDLHIVNKEVAQQIEYGAEWGISPTLQILDKDDKLVMTLFENINFSLVITPAMDTNYINENKKEVKENSKGKEDNKMDFEQVKKETEKELSKLSDENADSAESETPKDSSESDTPDKTEDVPADEGKQVEEDAKKDEEVKEEDTKEEEDKEEEKKDEEEEEVELVSKSKLESIGIRLHKISEMPEAKAFKSEIEAAVKEILDIADMALGFSKKQQELADTINQMEQMAAKLSESSEMIKEKDKMVATYQSKVRKLNSKVAMFKERDQLKEQERKLAKFDNVVSNYCKFHGYSTASQIEDAKTRLSSLSDEALEMIGRDVNTGLVESDVVMPRNSAQLSQTVVAPTVEKTQEASHEDKMESLFEKFAQADDNK